MRSEAEMDSMDFFWFGGEKGITIQFTALGMLIRLTLLKPLITLISPLRSRELCVFLMEPSLSFVALVVYTSVSVGGVHISQSITVDRQMKKYEVPRSIYKQT